MHRHVEGVTFSTVLCSPQGQLEVEAHRIYGVAGFNLRLWHYPVCDSFVTFNTVISALYL